METGEGRRKCRVPLRCPECRSRYDDARDVAGMRAAHKAVKLAIKTGALLPARAHVCTDCGSPAVCYDHRDYSRPLDVQPVCIGCNWRRGPGLPSVSTNHAEPA